MPQIENSQPNPLNKSEIKVLKELFKKYTKAVVRREFTAGFSTSRVFLVQPIQAGSPPELPVIVKLDRFDAVQAEVEAYETFITNRLQGAVKIIGEPAYVTGSELAGTKYEFAGGDLFDIISLQEWVETKEPSQIHAIFNRIKIVFHRLYAQQHFSAALNYSRYYDRILPFNFAAQFMATPTNQPTWSTPQTIPSQINIGDELQLFGFTVIKQLRSKRALMCSNTQTDGNYHFFVEEMPPDIDWDDYPVGESLPAPIFARVTATRNTFLQAKIEQAFGVTTPVLNLNLNRNEKTLSDPLESLSSQRYTTGGVNLAPIHGDLNLQNILVDKQVGIAYVIDFAQTRTDHVIRDALHMEMVLVTTILATAFHATSSQPAVLFELYRYLHWAGQSGDDDQVLPEPWSGEVWKRPLAALTAVRKFAAPLLSQSNRWEEYYQGLYFYMLGCLKFGSLYDTESGKYPPQLAYWAAAIALEFKDRPPERVEQNQATTLPQTIPQNDDVKTPEVIRRSSPTPPERSTDTKILRRVLVNHSNLRDLKLIAHELDIPDYTFSNPNNLIDVTLDLISYCKRRGKLEQLSQEINADMWHAYHQSLD